MYIIGWILIGWAIINTIVLLLAMSRPVVAHYLYKIFFQENKK